MHRFTLHFLLLFLLPRLALVLALPRCSVRHLMHRLGLHLNRHFVFRQCLAGKLGFEDGRLVCGGGDGFVGVGVCGGVLGAISFAAEEAEDGGDG
ncbi:hypothetical protein BDV95DRAFT_582452 [Massariosphaeria phaeospora]|uniref:Secreted protein n=1 Tax=Massariosphaeria phaeospora TaxID=100035 RepID=A0A7C8I1V7_9PLEO|nr:hypothetical protein BDV95DRAFT_582452 [Massariosphaeria phaeospora]